MDLRDAGAAGDAVAALPADGFVRAAVNAAVAAGEGKQADDAAEALCSRVGGQDFANADLAAVFKEGADLVFQGAEVDFGLFDQCAHAVQIDFRGGAVVHFAGWRARGRVV